MKAKHKYANQGETNMSIKLDCIKIALLPYVASLITLNLSRSNAITETPNNKTIRENNSAEFRARFHKLTLSFSIEDKGFILFPFDCF